MKKNQAFWIPLAMCLAAGAFLTSCQDDDDVSPIDPTPIEVISDAPAVRLKDLRVDKLPSPYYAFEYDEQGFISQLSFGSNLFSYRLTYQNKRISQMIRLGNTADTLFYEYQNGNVSRIREYSAEEKKIIRTYHFSYNNQRQLTEARYYFFDSPNPNDSLYFRRMNFVYSGKNASEIKDYRNNGQGVMNLITTQTFSQFDNGTYMENFSWLKDSHFSPVIFLPQVKIFENNYGKHTWEGIVMGLDIQYTYQTTNGRTTQATADMLQTKGEQAGTRVTSRAYYSYWE